MTHFLSGVQAVEQAREGDGFADVLETANPGNRALDSESKATVGDRAVASEVEIPIVIVAGQVVLVEALFEQGKVVDPLASADDLPIAFRREQIVAECQLRP